ncbi:MULTISPECIES: hypothetical protein [Amycolatopsis]|uniref:hypothetical protein n=1 Tax=Amycolatopsis TaxID=1813 RepID=UPI0018E958AF|nr:MULTISPECIES: hypothetical protein [Amycolatopsis]
MILLAVVWLFLTWSVPDRGQLIQALLGLAAGLGLERVTVHSSSRAVAAYRRHGFAASPRLLHAVLVPPAR